VMLDSVHGGGGLRHAPYSPACPARAATIALAVSADLSAARRDRRPRRRAQPRPPADERTGRGRGAVRQRATTRRARPATPAGGPSFSGRRAGCSD
jgi:hypothetical protein